MAESTSGAIKAGGAYVTLFADGGPLDKALDKAQRRLNSWGASIMGLGSKVFAAGVALDAMGDATVFAFAKMAGEAGKFANRTGIGVERASALSYALQRAGGDADMFARSLLHMDLLLEAASMGGKEATMTMTKLGLSFAQFQNVTGDVAFKKFATAIAGVKNPMEQAALAQQVFGKGVLEIITLLRKGEAGINEFMEEAKRLGLVVSPEDAAMAKEFNVMMFQMKESIKRVAYELGRALMPHLKAFREHIQPILTATIEWIRTHTPLIAMLGRVGLIIAGVGVGLFVLGLMFKIAAVGVGVLTVALNVVRVPIIVFNFLLAATKVLLLVLNPEMLLLAAGIALVVAAIGGIAYALLNMATSGDPIGAIGRQFGNVAQEAKDAWGGVVEALQSGDLAAAGKVALAFLKLEWVRFKGWLSNFWEEIKLGFNVTWMSIRDTALEHFALMKVGIIGMWEDMLAGLKRGYIIWELMFTKNMSLEDANAKIAHVNATRDLNKAIAAGDFLKFKQGLEDRRGKDTLQGAMDLWLKKLPHDQEILAAQKELADAIEGAHGLGAAPPPGVTSLGGDAASFGTTPAATVGTFAGLAAERLGGGATVAERTATAAEHTAERLQIVIAEQQRLNDVLAGNLQFG